MPLFMDIHEFGAGICATTVADAHRRDREVEREHQVRFRGCWVDEQAGRVFCLLEAPDASVAAAVHRDSHGLVAHEVHEVLAWGEGQDVRAGHAPRPRHGDGQGQKVRAGQQERAGQVGDVGHVTDEGQGGRVGPDGREDLGRSG